jgi:lipopolysaccharide export system protein LptA
MKTSICCTAVVAIIGLTGYLAAQAKTPRHPASVTYGPSSSPTQITADDITYNEPQRTTYARGNVRIVSEVSTISADEADVHLLNFSRVSRMSVDLRGNVRVLIDPSTR